MTDDPVTLWLNELRNADDSAATNLWNHFVDRIRSVASRKLSLETRRVYDEEDVAQSVFHSICAGIAAGRFPDLNDRDCLWRLIMVITSRKVSFRHRYDRRDCRDVLRNVTDSHSTDFAAPAITNHALSRELTPEFATEFLDTFELLINNLDDNGLEQVVLLRMEGYTDTEIASRLHCSRRTVQRRLEMIRRHLQRMEFVSE